MYVLFIGLIKHYVWNQSSYLLRCVSGGCFGNDGKKYVIGGWAWACCCVTEVQRYDFICLQFYVIAYFAANI